MSERTERWSRYRECLELEAQYGQFMPCEGHTHPDDLRPGHRQARAGGFATPILATILDGLRALRNALRMT